MPSTPVVALVALSIDTRITRTLAASVAALIGPENRSVMSAVVEKPSSAFIAAKCGVNAAIDDGRFSVPSVVPLK